MSPQLLELMPVSLPNGTGQGPSPWCYQLLVPCAEALNPGVATLGLRIPACKAMLDLLRCSGPLATTSANVSGEPSSRTEIEAARAFPDLPLLSPIPWPAPSCQASSVIAWRGPQGWHWLRRGAVMPAGVVSLPECSG